MPSSGANVAVRRTVAIRILCAFAIWIAVARGCPAQTSGLPAQTPPKPPTLEQRVADGDPSAFIEAADTNRKDLIPAIEKFGGDSAAQKALAKLGVKKYSDEILLEATDPTNSPAARLTMAQPGVPGFPPKHVGLEVQMRAFKKLAYVKDSSTIRTLASFLYAKENPEDYVERGGFDMVVYEPPSRMAMKTLAQVVDNPPANRDVKAWQQWWEQNKDKYP
jgi:hypothetical protein